MSGHPRTTATARPPADGSAGTGARTAVATPSPAEVLRRIACVPDSFRTFTVPQPDAARVHGVDDPLLEELLDLGLPHRDRDGIRHLDLLDLENAGLALRLPCPRRTAMRWWSQSLRDGDQDRPVRYQVTVKVLCPDPGHDGECHLRLHPNLFHDVQPGSLSRLDPGTVRFDMVLPPVRHFFGAPFLDLIEEVRPVQFHLLPLGLNRERGFLQDSGLADCRLATLHFAERGRELGLPVRQAVGIFVAVPYSVTHCWLEFEVDGEWIGADPFLLNAFTRWGVVDPDQWPLHRSPQMALWRLDEDDRFALATHRGTEHADASFTIARRSSHVGSSIRDA